MARINQYLICFKWCVFVKFLSIIILIFVYYCHYYHFIIMLGHCYCYYYCHCYCYCHCHSHCYWYWYWYQRCQRQRQCFALFWLHERLGYGSINECNDCIYHSHRACAVPLSSFDRIIHARGKQSFSRSDQWDKSCSHQNTVPEDVPRLSVEFQHN